LQVVAVEVDVPVAAGKLTAHVAIQLDAAGQGAAGVDVALVDLDDVAVRIANEVRRIQGVIRGCGHRAQAEAAADGVDSLDFPPVDTDIDLGRGGQHEADAFL